MQADQVVQFMNGSIEQDLDKTGSKKSFFKTLLFNEGKSSINIKIKQKQSFKDPF